MARNACIWNRVWEEGYVWGLVGLAVYGQALPAVPPAIVMAVGIHTGGTTGAEAQACTLQEGAWVQLPGQAERWVAQARIIQSNYFQRTLLNPCTGEERIEYKTESVQLRPAVPDVQVTDVNRPAADAAGGRPLPGGTSGGLAPRGGSLPEPVEFADSGAAGAVLPVFPQLPLPYAILLGLVVVAWRRFQVRWTERLFDSTGRALRSAGEAVREAGREMQIAAGRFAERVSRFWRLRSADMERFVEREWQRVQQVFTELGIAIRRLRDKAADWLYAKVTGAPNWLRTAAAYTVNGLFSVLTGATLEEWRNIRNWGWKKWVWVGFNLLLTASALGRVLGWGVRLTFWLGRGVGGVLLRVAGPIGRPLVRIAGRVLLRTAGPTGRLLDRAFRAGGGAMGTLIERMGKAMLPLLVRGRTAFGGAVGRFMATPAGRTVGRAWKAAATGFGQKLGARLRSAGTSLGVWARSAVGAGGRLAREGARVLRVGVAALKGIPVLANRLWQQVASNAAKVGQKLSGTWLGGTIQSVTGQLGKLPLVQRALNRFRQVYGWAVTMYRREGSQGLVSLLSPDPSNPVIRWTLQRVGKMADKVGLGRLGAGISRLTRTGWLTDPDTWASVRGFFSKNFAEPVVGLLQKGAERLSRRVTSKIGRVLMEDVHRLIRSGGDRMALRQVQETGQSLAEVFKSLRGEQLQPGLSPSNTQE